ncbi:MAG TPA: SgcJ/EcaC family oxidoreductase [Bryobacteraceae bacterium]|jgi:uncharacterized protein (TIGR02246 family)|nr:SgcJ/EcaC family oxidoreductase [Bryobacteraceae bacterium]
MRRALRSLAFITVSALVSAQQKQPEAAVRHVIAEYADARKHSDVRALNDLLTADVDQLVSSGTWRRGREEAVRGMLASSKTEGDRTITVETVRFPSPDVAIADARYELAASGGAAARKMWSTFVLVKQDGRWRISAIRNMLPAR